MPPGTDCPYPIRILVFFEMIRPYHIHVNLTSQMTEFFQPATHVRADWDWVSYVRVLHVLHTV